MQRFTINGFKKMIFFRHLNDLSHLAARAGFTVSACIILNHWEFVLTIKMLHIVFLQPILYLLFPAIRHRH